MTVSTAERADTNLHRTILEELAFDPAIDAGKIGIAAENGVVTLTGTVQTFTEKWAAEKAVKRVRGVRAFANEIVVELIGTHKVSDTDIAAGAANVLAWDPSLPSTIQIEVHDGVVSLSGAVDWQYQRALAEKHLRRIKGVVAIVNNLQLRSSVAPNDVKERIKSARERDADIEAANIDIGVAQGKVTLRGTVHSWSECDAAMRAAWSVPGIQSVSNELTVSL